MRNLEVTTVALTNSATAVCASQTRASAGALTINGAVVTAGVAIIAMAQKISITGASDNSGITYTIAGTDADDKTISEVLTGHGAGLVVFSVYYFKTVTGVTVSAAMTGSSTVGAISSSSGGASTKTLRVNSKQPDFGLGLYVDLVGSAAMTYTVQVSPDEPEDTVVLSYATDAAWFNQADMTSKTADAYALMITPCQTIRLIITAYTGGVAKLYSVQSQ
jgi:hypothetical protein